MSAVLNSPFRGPHLVNISIYIHIVQCYKLFRSHFSEVNAQW